MIKKKVLLTAMSSVMTLGLLSACGVDDNNLNNDDDVNYRPVRYNQNDDNGILDNNNGNRGNGIFNNDNDDNNGIFDNDRNGRNNDIFDNDNDDNDLDLDLNDDNNNNDRNGLGGNNGNMTGRNR